MPTTPIGGGRVLAVITTVTYKHATFNGRLSAAPSPPDYGVVIDMSSQ